MSYIIIKQTDNGLLMYTGKNTSKWTSILSEAKRFSDDKDTQSIARSVLGKVVEEPKK